MSLSHARGLLLTLCFLSLAACSGGSNSRIDYKEAKTLPSLEVPPELSAPVDTGVVNVPQRGAVAGAPGTTGTRILPMGEGVRIARDGSTRWLVVDQTPEALWPRLHDFWATLGLEVKLDAPGIAIMETEWAENRADAPGGFLTGLVKKVFKNAYSADTRDKYRLRLEPRDDGRSELFITHYGLKEVVAGQTVEGFVETAWQVRPSDPELTNEILNRLILHLGGSEEAARAALEPGAEQQPPRSRIVDDVIVLEEGFSRAWRLTGLALDRIGLVVDDRNRSEGIFYVSRVNQLEDAGVGDSGGWFGGLFSSDDAQAKRLEKVEVHLSGDDTASRIRLRDGQGSALTSEQALPILQRLQESLR